MSDRATQARSLAQEIYDAPEDEVSAFTRGLFDPRFVSGYADDYFFLFLEKCATAPDGQLSEKWRARCLDFTKGVKR